MKIQLSDHFTTGKLLRFVAPSIVMMIFTSVYGVVDGLFVSNFVGKTAFAAVNLIFPLLMILGALGFMIGTGGSALVARTLGEGDSGRAQRYFSMLVYVTIGGGIVFSVLGLLFLRPIAVLLGAQGAMLEDCVVYGGILLAGQTMFMLQNVFQSFLITAEKPHFGLGVTVAAGLTNIILDFLFIAVFRWGVAGAAIATAASQFVGGGVPLLYFARPNRSLLRLGKTKLDSRALLKACTNGSSELMTNLSSSLVTVLYNFQLMQLAGEDGIAAYGVIMYVNFIFIAIFIGYSIGSAPVVGYHHGAGNSTELKSLFRKSLLLVGAAGSLREQGIAAVIAGNGGDKQLLRRVIRENNWENILLLDAQSERRQRTLYGLADILYYGDDRRCDAPYGPYTPLLLRMMQNEKPILTVTHSPFNDAQRAGCAVPAGQVTQRGVEEALLSFTMMNGEKRVVLGRQAGDALCITHAPAQVARDYRGALLRLWV